jgi:hypothetical protein
MLSKKLSIDDGVKIFTSKNWSSAAKIRNTCRSFCLYHFFSPLRRSVSSTPSLKAFSY